MKQAKKPVKSLNTTKPASKKPVVGGSKTPTKLVKSATPNKVTKPVINKKLPLKKLTKEQAASKKKRDLTKSILAKYQKKQAKTIERLIDAEAKQQDDSMNEELKRLQDQENDKAANEAAKDLDSDYGEGENGEQTEIQKQIAAQQKAAETESDTGLTAAMEKQ